MKARPGDLSRMLRSWTAVPLYLCCGLPALAASLALAVWLEPDWSLVIPAPTAAVVLLLLAGVAAAFGLIFARLRQTADQSARNEESLRLAQTYAHEAAWDLDPRTGSLNERPISIGCTAWRRDPSPHTKRGAGWCIRTTSSGWIPS